MVHYSMSQCDIIYPGGAGLRRELQGGRLIITTLIVSIIIIMVMVMVMVIVISISISIGIFNIIYSLL